MAEYDYEAYEESVEADPTQRGAGFGRTVSILGGLASLALVAGVGVWSYQLMMRDVSGVPVVRPYSPPILFADYVTAAKDFIGPGALEDGVAFADRSGGNLSRPFYPDGIRNNEHGPFSKIFELAEPGQVQWSVFSSGLQLDLVLGQILQHVLFALGDPRFEDVGPNCLGPDAPDRVNNGIQIFPGSVPIYRGDQLVGGIGISGDGIDQDDMISFLGLHEAGLALAEAGAANPIGNAPKDMRADQLKPRGERLRYVQCPQTPYIGSSENFVCDGK